MPSPALSTRRLAVVTALLLLVPGCGPRTPEVAPSRSASPSVEASPTAEVALGVVRTVLVGGVDVELEVGPVVVDDGVGVLRIAGAPVSEPGVNLVFELYSAFIDPDPSANAVRLVDLERRTVSTVARKADGNAVTAEDPVAAEPGGEPQVLHVAFAAPESDTVDVLVPMAGYFPGVPVVSGQAPGVAPLSELTDAAPASLALHVAPLETFSEVVGGDVRTRAAEGEVAVQVAADVLFAVDSAELTPEADDALSAAGAQLAGSTGGVLRVVGHTDDVAATSYNQELSERRAQAVADRLATLVDLGDVQVEVEGRGETEPAVPGSSDEARTLNRRVELRFRSDPAEVRPETAGGEVPPPTGPTGTGAAGVVVEHDEHTYEVAVQQVVRRHGYLVGEVRLTNAGSTRIPAVNLLASVWDARGDLGSAHPFAVSKLTVLDGSTRHFPVDHTTDGGQRTVLADRDPGPLEPGESMTVTVVWPDVPGDSIVVDSPQMVLQRGAGELKHGGPPFRLTDVRVTTEFV